MLDPVVDARAPTETGQSPKVISPAKYIHPEGYTICPQLQVTTLASLSFAEVGVKKTLKRIKNYGFLSRSHWLTFIPYFLSRGSNNAHVPHEISCCGL